MYCLSTFKCTYDFAEVYDFNSLCLCIGGDLKAKKVEFNGQVFIHLPKEFTAKPLPLLLQDKSTLHGATLYVESILCWTKHNHFTCVQYIHAGTSGFRTGWYAYDELTAYYEKRQLRTLSPNVTFLFSPQHVWFDLHQVFDLEYSRTVIRSGFADFEPGPFIDQQKLPSQPKKSNTISL